MIQILPLVFYGGTPQEYISFAVQTFRLPSYVAQIDLAPAIPRISGERNIKAFPSFVPTFYYSYSQEQSIGVFRGKLYSPSLCAIKNPYTDFAWSRGILAKKCVEGKDFEYGYLKTSDEIVAWGNFTIGQLLKDIFPDVKIKPSFMCQISVVVNINRKKKSEVVKALEKCADCTFKVQDGSLIVLADGAKIRFKLQATLDEYERVGASGAGQMSFLEHSLLLNLSDGDLAKVYVGELVKTTVTDKDVIRKLDTIMDASEKQTTIAGVNMFQLYRDRDRSYPVQFNYYSFGQVEHICRSVIDGQLGTVSF